MRRTFKGISVYLLIVVVIMFLLTTFGSKNVVIKEMDITELIGNLENGNVASINMVERQVQGKLKDDSQFTAVLTEEIKVDFYKEYLKDLVDSEQLAYSGELPKATPWILTILPMLVTLLIFGVFWFVFMQQSQGGGGKVMSFGKSKAKIHKEEGEKLTFEEVAGLKEEKEEMAEIVDFLKTPKKYIEIGARIPSGVLLVGPPGTGKTYLSRAVAGEAEVPFFTISGSEFVEMFVGVGASRVRDLFEQAKKNA